MTDQNTPDHVAPGNFNATPQGGHERTLTMRVTGWSAAHPWRALIAWLAFVATCLLVGRLVEINPTTPKDFWMGEAGAAEALADSGGMLQPIVEKILITSKHGPLDSATATTAATALVELARANQGVRSVAQPIRSADGQAVVVAITMEGTSKAAAPWVRTLQTQAAAVQAANGDLLLFQTGSSSVSLGIQQQLGHDLRRAEMITLPVTLLILFFVFGSLFAAGVPLLIALTSITAAFAVYPITTYFFPDAGGAVANVMLMMGLAVGVDYCLFFIKRVREELHRTAGSEAAAVNLAAASAGRAIVVSGVAVLVSLIGLYFGDDVIFSSVATGSILVVLIAMAGTLTVLPALLVKFGKRTVLRPGSVSSHPTNRGPGRFWSAMLRPAMQRPGITLLAAMTLLAALALPAANLRISVEGVDTFPRNIPAVAAYDQLISTFPAEGVAHFVVIRADPAQSDAVRTALAEIARATQDDPLFAVNPTPSIQTSADQRVSTLEIPIPYGASSIEGARSLALVRGKLVPQSIGKIPGAQFAVSGQVARSTDYVAHQAANMPLVIGFVLLATFLIIMAAFRSVLIGIIGVALNILSAAAALGALVLVFQYGWGEDLLGFTSVGFIGSRIPLLLFVVLFGLSMDYQVFVVSRIREFILSGRSNRDSVFAGITKSASVVTSAAVVMVSVFVSFIFVNLVELKQVGFGLAFAVLLDAFIIRTMVLPALMLLIGDACWWPGRGRSIQKTAQTDAVPHGSSRAGQ